MQTVGRCRPFRVKRWLSIVLLVALLVPAWPTSLGAAKDARATAQEDATAILLGEYVQQDAAEDDLFAFAIYLPEEGNYMISPDDDEAAQNFAAVILDTQGEIVYEGPLAMEEVALGAGEYTIEVTALADSVLSFFVLGVIGGMSDSERAPGKLYAGSIYAEEAVSETRYATVTIPDVGYAQEVLLYFKAGDGDSLSVSVNGGESISKYANSDDTDMIRFYSEGGSYALTVEPLARRSSFTVIVFLAGPPVQLELDGTVEATLSADTDTQVFRFRVDDVYDDVTITLTPESESEASLSMTVVDHYEAGSFYVYSDTLDDGTLSSSTGALLPGDYYVVVTSYDGLEANYTLTAEGTPGAPMLLLTLDETTEGALEEAGFQYHRLDGVKAGTFVRITLTSSAQESDFDLHVGITQPLDQWSSSATGPNEEVILVAPGDGTYYVQVRSYSGAGDYELLAEVIDGVGLIEANDLIVQSINEAGYIVYGFAIDKPGQLLSVLLVSLEAADLDLTVVHFDPNGTRVHNLSSVSAGSSEIVSQAAADMGIYEVRVKAFGEGGTFGLQVRVEDPAALLAAAGQISGTNTTILSDDFSDPDSGWASDDENSDYGYVDGTYQMTVDPGVYRWVVQDSKTYIDVSLEVEIIQLSGTPDAYAGLICRSSEDGYFYADISPAGDFAIGQIAGEEVTLLSEWTTNDAIDTAEGAVNLLRLDCIGDTITAYVNGTELNSVTVEEREGGFGFEAGNIAAATEPATLLFDNYVLSQP